LTPPHLALDAAGRPWVAWAHVADRSHVFHVVHFDGNAFVEAPAGLPTALSSIDAMTLVGGDAVIAGNDDFGWIDVVRLHGGAWEAPVLVAPPPGNMVSGELVPAGHDAMLIVDSLSQLVEVTRVLFP